MGDELTPEDRKLLSEVKIRLENSNEKFDELKKILFGEHADGFLYKFARMEPDIESIPELKEKVEVALNEAKDASEKLNSIIDKVEAHDRYILKQTIMRTLIIMLISGVTSSLISLLTLWTMLHDVIDKWKIKGTLP